MQSSNHRLRDMEQHHPLLSAGADVETGGLGAGVMVGGPHSGYTAGNRTLWFIQDSCGMVCATMTWFLVLYAEFVVNFVMLLPAKNFWYSLLNGATFNSLAVLALASHMRTMLTDPVRRVIILMMDHTEQRKSSIWCILNWESLLEMWLYKLQHKSKSAAAVWHLESLVNIIWNTELMECVKCVRGSKLCVKSCTEHTILLKVYQLLYLIKQHSSGVHPSWFICLSRYRF